MMDDIMYEINRIAQIELILENDLKQLATCYLKSSDTESMLFPKILSSSHLSISNTHKNNPYNLQLTDIQKPLKELLPRFVSQITKLDQSEPLDENRIYAYLTYYSGLIR